MMLPFIFFLLMGELFRWMQPGTIAATEYRIYVGPQVGAGRVVYTGLPTPDAEGVFAADVTIPEIHNDGRGAWVWVTAANGDGESPPSNGRKYVATRRSGIGGGGAQ